MFFVKNKVARGASYLELPKENLATVYIENKGELCESYSLLLFLQPPRDNQNRVNNKTQHLHEIGKIGVYLPYGLKVDDIEKLEKLNNFKKNV